MILLLFSQRPAWLLGATATIKRGPWFYGLVVDLDQSRPRAGFEVIRR